MLYLLHLPWQVDEVNCCRLGTQDTTPPPSSNCLFLFLHLPLSRSKLDVGRRKNVRNNPYYHKKRKWTCLCGELAGQQVSRTVRAQQLNDIPPFPGLASTSGTNPRPGHVLYRLAQLNGVAVSQFARLAGTPAVPGQLSQVCGPAGAGRQGGGVGKHLPARRT